MTSLPMTSAFFWVPAPTNCGAHGQCVNKTRARRRKIESPCVRGAQLVLDQACGRGKHHVRSHAGDYD